MASVVMRREKVLQILDFDFIPVRDFLIKSGEMKVPYKAYNGKMTRLVHSNPFDSSDSSFKYDAVGIKEILQAINLFPENIVDIKRICSNKDVESVILSQDEYDCISMFSCPDSLQGVYDKVLRAVGFYLKEILNDIFIECFPAWRTL